MIPKAFKAILTPEDDPPDEVIEIMADLHVSEKEARFIFGLISGTVVGDNVIRTADDQLISASSGITVSERVEGR